MKRISGLLLLLNISIWLAVFSIDNNLHIIACDVGQGDAILIQKLRTQILIDGGPDRKVLDCLGRHMPFWDRTIELVILTHPQMDHYGGLIDIFKNYKVDKFGEYKRESSSQGYKVLENEVVDRLTLTTGTKIRLGMIYLDMVAESKDQGIVTLLEYYGYKALFMADVETGVSNQLSENSKIYNVDYIKVNHHGSKNGLTEKLLQATMPKIAVISVGKNSYGHPHKEILQMLKNSNVKILRTDLPRQGRVGDVDIKTDSVNFWYNK